MASSISSVSRSLTWWRKHDAPPRVWVRADSDDMSSPYCSDACEAAVGADRAVLDALGRFCTLSHLDRRFSCMHSMPHRLQRLRNRSFPMTTLTALAVSTPNLELCCRAISAQRSVRSPALAPYKQRNRGLEIRPGFAVCLSLRWYLITVMHHYSKRASTQRNLKLFNASINETQSLFTGETKLRGLSAL